MTTTYTDEVILDASGAPLGVYRENQDPSDPQRVHPVPRTNFRGDPIVENGEPVTADLSLDDPRTLQQLAKEGLQVDGNALVAIEGHPLTDPVTD